MDQDETWRGGRPWPWQHCVRWGPSSPSPNGAQPSNFQVITKQWPNRFELRCVRPSVCTSTKSFSDFDLIWCMGRPRPVMRTSMTLTLSKVKVLELLKFWKLLFSRSISSIFAWSSKLMVGDDSMGPGLQLVYSPIFEFPSKKVTTRVQTSRHVDIWRNSNGCILVLRETTVTWSGKLVVLHALCMLMWPWSDPRSRSRGFWTSKNCRKLHFSRSISSAILAWSSKLMVDRDSVGSSL